MDYNSAFDSFELQLNDMAKSFLRETAKWAKFLSIIGFIGIGFLVIFALVMFAMGGSLAASGMGAMGGIGAMGGVFGGVLYLLFAMLYFFPIMYLFKFSSSILNAFQNNNTEQLTKGFEYLKSHYKFVGILMAILIGLYALIFIFALLALLFS